jgi:site-specific DNA-methyltransferase (adenine-specific)
MEINKIYNLDCLELFKQMKGKNILVDAIITDPPYNLDFVNKKLFTPSVSEKWDNNFDQLVWIKEVAPLVKEEGSVIIFNHW